MVQKAYSGFPGVKRLGNNGGFGCRVTKKILVYSSPRLRQEETKGGFFSVEYTWLKISDSFRWNNLEKQCDGAE